MKIGKVFAYLGHATRLSTLPRCMGVESSGRSWVVEKARIPQALLILRETLLRRDFGFKPAHVGSLRHGGKVPV